MTLIQLRISRLQNSPVLPKNDENHSLNFQNQIKISQSSIKFTKIQENQQIRSLLNFLMAPNFLSLPRITLVKVTVQAEPVVPLLLYYFVHTIGTTLPAFKSRLN
jgi:hypothetical protein